MGSIPSDIVALTNSYVKQTWIYFVDTDGYIRLSRGPVGKTEADAEEADPPERYMTTGRLKLKGDDNNLARANPQQPKLAAVEWEKDGRYETRIYYVKLVIDKAGNKKNKLCELGFTSAPGDNPSYVWTGSLDAKGFDVAATSLLTATVDGTSLRVFFQRADENALWVAYAPLGTKTWNSRLAMDFDSPAPADTGSGGPKPTPPVVCPPVPNGPTPSDPPKPEPTPTPGSDPNPNPTPSDPPNPDPTPTPSDPPKPDPTPTPGNDPNPNPTPSDPPNPDPTPTPGNDPNPNPTPSDPPNPDPIPTPGNDPNPNPTPSDPPNPNPNPNGGNNPGPIPPPKPTPGGGNNPTPNNGGGRGGNNGGWNGGRNNNGGRCGNCGGCRQQGGRGDCHQNNPRSG